MRRQVRLSLKSHTHQVVSRSVPYRWQEEGMHNPWAATLKVGQTFNRAPFDRYRPNGNALLHFWCLRAQPDRTTRQNNHRSQGDCTTHNHRPQLYASHESSSSHLMSSHLIGVNRKITQWWKVLLFPKVGQEDTWSIFLESVSSPLVTVEPPQLGWQWLLTQNGPEEPKSRHRSQKRTPPNTLVDGCKAVERLDKSESILVGSK